MIRWHRIRDRQRGWYAEIDGRVIAEAHNTSATGTDDYPWDWYLTDDAIPIGRRTSGVADSLRSAKEHVKESAS